jgi:hypothetical protein
VLCFLQLILSTHVEGLKYGTQFLFCVNLVLLHSFACAENGVHVGVDCSTHSSLDRYRLSVLPSEDMINHSFVFLPCV